MSNYHRIIDNKRIQLTEQEWNSYQELCKAYDRPNFKGADLFRGLFDTNNEGVITFIHPPSTSYTSFEVFFWVLAIYQQQQMRVLQKRFDELYLEMRKKIDELGK